MRQVWHFLTSTDPYGRALWVHDGPELREEMQRYFADQPLGARVRIVDVEKDGAAATVTALVSYADGTERRVPIVVRKRPGLAGGLAGDAGAVGVIPELSDFVAHASETGSRGACPIPLPSAGAPGTPTRPASVPWERRARHTDREAQDQVGGSHRGIVLARRPRMTPSQGRTAGEKRTPRTGGA
jgi:hypothetical protein